MNGQDSKSSIKLKRRKNCLFSLMFDNNNDSLVILSSCLVVKKAGGDFEKTPEPVNLKL